MREIENLAKVFSNRLKELLKNSNNEQSIAELSKNCKIPRTTINSWILGKKCPSIDSACQIADYFGVSLDYLFGLKDFE